MDRNGFGYDVNGIAGRMRRRRRTGASKRPDGSSEAATTLRFATWDTGDALKIEQEIAKKFESRIRHEGAGRGLCRRIRSEAGRRIRRANPRT